MARARRTLSMMCEFTRSESLSCVPLPQLNDCTSPAQAGIAGQGPDLLGEAYGVISHSEHRRFAPYQVDEDHSERLDLFLKPCERCFAAAGTKYQIRRKEEQHRRPQKTLTRFMLNGSLSGTLLWCLEGRRNEFDILFREIEHGVAEDDAKDTGNR